MELLALMALVPKKVSKDILVYLNSIYTVVKVTTYI